MATEQATTKILSELDRVLDTLNADLDRVAILTGALAGFSRPVPDYEPMFRHLRARPLVEHELCTSRERRAD